MIWVGIGLIAIAIACAISILKYEIEAARDRRNQD